MGHGSHSNVNMMGQILSVCLSVCDVGGSGSRPHRLEILETNCTDN